MEMEKLLLPFRRLHPLEDGVWNMGNFHDLQLHQFNHHVYKKISEPFLLELTDLLSLLLCDAVII
jgi:hypothetical protein